MSDYHSYMEEWRKDIEKCVEDMGCQPIVFIGSGISKRYFSAPNWDELLTKLCEICPNVERPFAYFRQTFDSNPKIGSALAERFKEWAWSEQACDFPEYLYSAEQPADIYFKYKISKIIEEMTPKNLLPHALNEMNEEIIALQNLKPHAIITTNFDKLCEIIFPEYQPIIGQKILRHQYDAVGEILKIHGCISEPRSLVITEADYINFTKKTKYLSAKLLTFFSEHPLLFIGYSANDPNIKSILSDVDEILSPNGELIQNIYIVEWQKSLEKAPYSTDKSILISDGRSIRIKNIVTSSLKWVLESFSTNDSSIKVSPKLLRSLISKTTELVRRDFPTRKLNVNFEILENAVSSTENLAKLYGVTMLSNSSAINANFPYTLTDIAKKFGQIRWHYANSLIDNIKEKSGINLKESDNKYHIKVKSGNKSTIHKYSEDMYILLKQFLDSGKIPEIDIK